MEFKKGDLVYYHSRRLGTIPAIVKGVDRNPERKHDSVFIKGEAPVKKGYISAWVHVCNVKLQNPE